MQISGFKEAMSLRKYLGFVWFESFGGKERGGEGRFLI